LADLGGSALASFIPVSPYKALCMLDIAPLRLRRTSYILPQGEVLGDATTPAVDVSITTGETQTKYITRNLHITILHAMP
jgi:hypothetical protein